MPRFLALYTMRHEDFDAFRALPKSEQDAQEGADGEDTASEAEPADVEE